MEKEEILLVCDCSSNEHQIILSEIDGVVYASIHLKRLSFWKRLKVSLRYIMGYYSLYGHFEEFIFRKKDAEELGEVVRRLRSVDDK